MLDNEAGRGREGGEKGSALVYRLGRGKDTKETPGQNRYKNDVRDWFGIKFKQKRLILPLSFKAVRLFCLWKLKW